MGENLKMHRQVEQTEQVESFRLYGEDTGSPFLFVSDHAGRKIPSFLADLGVSEAVRATHIGWDIGIDGVGQVLAKKLSALLIEQQYSRLVIDCNRAPGHPTSIVSVSDGVVIPANQNISPEERTWREQAILFPYHDRITQELDKRQHQGRDTLLVALHSFTPIMDGFARPWHVGVLHNRDARFGAIMFRLLQAEGFTVGDNEPYRLTDFSDYTVPFHAEKRSLPYLEIEIRQDLISSVQGQEEWAERLSRLLPHAWQEFQTIYG